MLRWEKRRANGNRRCADMNLHAEPVEAGTAISKEEGTTLDTGGRSTLPLTFDWRDFACR